MGDWLAFEKSICFYITFLVGVDSGVSLTQVFWTISCLLAVDHIADSFELLGLLSGLVLLCYSLGKILTIKIVEEMYRKIHIKYIFLALTTCQAASYLILFVFQGFWTVLVSRVLSGISSNILISARKLLQTLILKEETDELHLFRIALIMNRSGLTLGTFLASFLFNSQIILTEKEKKLKILAVLLFFLSLFAFFGAFLVKSPLFFVNEHKNRYAELPEIKASSDVSDSERNTKEANDSNNLFSTAILANYHPPEECLGPEAVKYYSPRAVVNKESIPKMIQSARPKLGASFDFPENEHNEEYHESQEDYDKKVHISFIDEEFENEETFEKNDESVNKTQSSTLPPVLSPEKVLKKLALNVRIMVSVSTGLLFEVVPVSAYIKLAAKGQDFVLIACGVSIIVALVMFQVFSARIMENIQVYRQVVVFSLAAAGIFVLFPVLDVMSKDPVILIPSWVLSLFLAEALAPTGVVLLSDSVGIAEREKEINESNFYCAVFKAFSTYFAVAFAAAGAWNSLAMAGLATPFIFTGYFGKKFQENWVQLGFKT